MLEEKLKFKQLKDYCPEFCGENTAADANKFYAEKGEFLQAAVKGEKNYTNAPRQVMFVSTHGLDTQLMHGVLTKAFAASMCATLLTYGML